MSDHVRIDELEVLVEELGEIRVLRLPADANHQPLGIVDIPFCEPCEGCGDPSGRKPGNGIRCGGQFGDQTVCSLCLGTGRTLFAWTAGVGPSVPVSVPAALAAPWLSDRAPMPISAAPSFPSPVST